MPSITDTPALTTPPEHELPEVLAFWEAYDEAYTALCEKAGLQITEADDDAIIGLIGDLISAVYKARP